MASALLYPPLVPDAIPAVTYEDLENNNNIVIPFEKSPIQYEEIPIKQIHFRILKIDNGIDIPITKANNYNQIGFKVFHDGIDDFKLELNLEDFDGSKDDILGNFYKVQIRLSSAGDISQSGFNDRWLNNNQNDFSEWSTYCSFKIITKPKYEISVPIYNYYNSLPFIKYTNGYETLELRNIPEKNKDYINYFNTQLIINNKIVESYENCSPQENGRIFWIFKTPIQKEQYVIKTKIITNNGYTDIVEYANSRIDGEKIFSIDLENYENKKENSKFIFDKENENNCGKIVLKASMENNDNQVQFYLILREDLYTGQRDFIYKENNKYNFSNLVFEDYLIEDNHRYIYYLCAVYDIYILWTKTKNYSQRNFEYSFLLGKNGKQLTLKFNNTINSIKYNINESKIDTLGSQYPYVIRNGAIKYKTFPIAGLISIDMDTFFGDTLDLNYIDDEYAKERLYRELVLDFLTEEIPKVLKSPTEGNLLIKLTDISLTPNQTLSRKIYSFSANAIEIEKFNIDNYNTLIINNNSKKIKNNSFIMDEILYSVIDSNWNLNENNIHNEHEN